MKYLEELNELRLEIEDIDKTIIKYLAKRLTTIKKIGELKANHNLNYVDIMREENLKNIHKQICQKYNIPDEFASEFFEIIFKFCREFQQPKI